MNVECVVQVGCMHDSVQIHLHVVNTLFLLLPVKTAD